MLNMLDPVRETFPTPVAEAPKKTKPHPKALRRLPSWLTDALTPREEKVLRVISAVLLASMVVPVVDRLLLGFTLGPIIHQEDGIVEMTTALIHLMAAAVGILAVRAAESARVRTGAILLTTVALLACLDELSFGLRLFPDVRLFKVSGVPIDSLHDFFLAGVRFLQRRGLVAVVVGGTTVVSTVSALIWRYRAWLLRFCRESIAARYLAAAIAMGIIALLIDTGREKRWHFIYSWEELLEMNAAIWLMAGASLQWLASRDARRSDAKGRSVAGS